MKGEEREKERERERDRKVVRRTNVLFPFFLGIEPRFVQPRHNVQTPYFYCRDASSSINGSRSCCAPSPSPSSEGDTRAASLILARSLYGFRRRFFGKYEFVRKFARISYLISLQFGIKKKFGVTIQVVSFQSVSKPVFT